MTIVTNDGIGIAPVESTIDGPNSPSTAIFKDPAMEAAVRKGKMTLKSVLTEFAEWTGIPGPIQLVYALNTFTVNNLKSYNHFGWLGPINKGFFCFFLFERQ